jgi:hypothetical protein
MMLDFRSRVQHVLGIGYLLEVRRVLRGLACGLAFAVKARWVGRGSGAQGWVPKVLSAKPLERTFECP